MAAGGGAVDPVDRDVLARLGCGVRRCGGVIDAHPCGGRRPVVAAAVVPPGWDAPQPLLDLAERGERGADHTGERGAGQDRTVKPVASLDKIGWPVAEAADVDG
jgi:hypothetical protein